MTTMIMMDADHSPAGVKRRLREEFARHSIESDSEAAELSRMPQQWLSRRMTGDTGWKLDELEEFCRALGLSYVYVAAGIRPIPSPPAGYEVRGDMTGAEVSQLRRKRRDRRVNKPVGESTDRRSAA